MEIQVRPKLWRLDDHEEDDDDEDEDEDEEEDDEEEEEDGVDHDQWSMMMTMIGTQP